VKTHEPQMGHNTKFFDANIKKLAKANSFFRQVVYTGPYSQLVVMSLPAGEEIGEEVHVNTDQILVIVDGEGEALLDGRPQPAPEHNVIFVTAGTRHNIRNVGKQDLKLFTIYAPPEHKDGTVHKTREEAMMEEQAA
jgi:mannose-6-phosphate isomerase-like protein (cupin superfamily)